MTHSGPERSAFAAMHGPGLLYFHDPWVWDQRDRRAAAAWLLAARRAGQSGYRRTPCDKIFRRYPHSGLTAPNGGIRSASSIGTVVCSSAVVVGQRSERGVP